MSKLFGLDKTLYKELYQELYIKGMGESEKAQMYNKKKTRQPKWDFITARIPEESRAIIAERVEELGTTMSEYIRYLIAKDIGQKFGD